MIVTWSGYWGRLGPASVEDWKVWTNRHLTFQGLPMVLDWRPKGKVYAQLDHNRWIVKCPECEGAELAEPAWALYKCCSCGYGVSRVVFPRNRSEIETVLLARPADNRNWWPGLRIEDLLRDNVAHLV